MAAHAQLGASSAKRWMACPGSVAASADRPNNTTVWAAEGTAAHDLGETCLLDEGQRSNPKDYLGGTIVVDKDGGHWEFEVNDNMVQAVSVYVDYVREILEPGDVLMIESRVSFKAMGPPGEDMFGTADTIIYRPSTKKLFVIDYKHGSGIAVDVTNNPQLMYYGIGAALHLQQPVVECELVVVQPRAPHADGPIRSQIIDVVDLMTWGYTELMPAAQRATEPDAPLFVSEECRFCRAAATCNALRQQALENAMLEFDEDNSAVEPTTTVDKMTAKQVRMVLDNATLITAWINAVQKFAHDELEAGRDPADGAYKLVEKRPVRKFKDPEAAADALCMAYGLGDEDIFEAPKMKSPAKIDEALKAQLVGLPRKESTAQKKAAKAFVDEFVESLSSGTTLAPVTDKREAVTKGRVTDFD